MKAYPKISPEENGEILRPEPKKKKKGGPEQAYDNIHRQDRGRDEGIVSRIRREKIPDMKKDIVSMFV
jgi:hypothetical protein